MSDDDKLILGDFGLAFPVTEQGPRLTAPRERIGPWQHYQRQQQLDQFLLEKRVETLTQFSSTIGKIEDFVSKLERLEQLTNDFIGSRNLKDLDEPKLAKELDAEQIHLKEEIRPQKVLLRVLFRAALPQETLEAREVPLLDYDRLKKLTDKQLIDLLIKDTQSQRENSQRIRKEWVERANGYQSLVDELSKKMY